MLVKIQTGYRRNMQQKYVSFPPGNQAGIFIRAPLKYNVFEIIMENGAFAPLEQMLHLP